ncbi:3-methyladenine DNA glycosylase [Ascochyta clinopodiicola]|nr:3-methyladenine DNA glycosylase [Ascochyta clinopodiicola]
MSLRRSERNADKKGIVSPEPVDVGKVKEIVTAGKSTTAPKKTTVAKKVAAPRKRKGVGEVKDSQTNGLDIGAKHADVVEKVDISKVPDASSTAKLPSTPRPSKRQRKTDANSPAKPVPPTSAPLDVPSNPPAKKDTDHIFDTLSHPRPASPHLTNAPILSPTNPNIIIAATPSPAKKAKAPPPDVGSPVKPAHTTTATLLRDAEAFLVRVDETGKLEKMIAREKCGVFSPEGLAEVVEPFTALASGIIGQQVSSRAASSIRQKFTSLFPSTHPSFPTPSQVISQDIPTLRSAGLSQRKAEYITGLAEKFASGALTAEGLVGASDEALIEQLVAVRGLGRWSVEMFACFGLRRMDVFSTGDLGVQ